jgi:hypothetical protein
MPTYTLPQNLGDILGAHHSGNLQTVIAELKPASGVLIRGSVLALVAGKLELVTATNQATAYGVLLDPTIDTGVAFGDGSVTGSVARAGSFRGGALIVSAGTDPIALVADLRDRGIYTEGSIPVPA